MLCQELDKNIQISITKSIVLTMTMLVFDDDENDQYDTNEMIADYDNDWYEMMDLIIESVSWELGAPQNSPQDNKLKLFFCSFDIISTYFCAVYNDKIIML